jgi:AraC-like DNA-binding protein
MPHHPTQQAGDRPGDSLYREAPPLDDLAPLVACLWVRTVQETTHRARIVPDACLDLMWITEGGGGRLVVAGPDTRAHITTLGPGTTIAGVRFAPGAATAVLGLPVDALRDERPVLADLWGRPEAERVATVVAAASRPERALAEAVTARDTQRPDPAMRHVARVLHDARHPAPVRGLADELGLSERQLHRRCTAAFGYGPKTLHRVLRFQRALVQARAGRDLAGVAHECGYADQPHLARDVLELAGTSLTTLLEGRGTGQAA